MSNIWPKRIDICPWGFWFSENTAVGTPSRLVVSAALSGGYLTTSSNQTSAGTYREYKVPLHDGTWTLDIIYTSVNSAGIVDTSLSGTIIDNDRDMYSSGSVQNVVASITGINISTSNIYTLRSEVVSKNPSSSFYGMRLQWYTFKRTA